MRNELPTDYDDLSRFGAMAPAVRRRCEQAYLWGVREGMRVQAEAISKPANLDGECFCFTCCSVKREEMEVPF